MGAKYIQRKTNERLEAKSESLAKLFEKLDQEVKSKKQKKSELKSLVSEQNQLYDRLVTVKNHLPSYTLKFKEHAVSKQDSSSSLTRRHGTNQSKKETDKVKTRERRKAIFMPTSSDQTSLGSEIQSQYQQQGGVFKDKALLQQLQILNAYPIAHHNFLSSSEEEQQAILKQISNIYPTVSHTFQNKGH